MGGGSSHDRRKFKKAVERRARELQSDVLEPEHLSRETEDHTLTESNNIGQRFFDFIEQPLFLAPVGIICGLVGVLFYAPVSIGCGVCILLAFHRAGVVKGKRAGVQVIAYGLLFFLTFAVLFYLGPQLRKNFHIPTASEIAEAVARKLSLSEASKPSAQSSAKPVVPTLNADVELKFLDPKDVLFQICNPRADNPANEPSYGFGLFDLDLPGDFKKQILPIRQVVITGGYIIPHYCAGARSVLSYQPEIRAMVKPGDKIFGWVTVTCHNCLKIKGYWLYFVDGQGGWYSRMPKKYEDGRTYFDIPIDSLRNDLSHTLDRMVPAAKRVKILPPA